MQRPIISFLQHAWNAFTSRDPTAVNSYPLSYYRPNRRGYYGVASERTIVTTVINKIAVDCAQVNVRHVKKDKDGNFKEEVNSHLNKALSVSANIDQTGRAFFQDLVHSMLDEGCAAAVPVETDISPIDTGQYDVTKLRVGRVVDWYPKTVRLVVYNEETGRNEEIVLPKSTVAIIENPFYAIMNEPNSTLRRLTKTLHDLDTINTTNASGKLDMIIQLPYSLRSPAKQQQAESRRMQLEDQLTGSKYGIGYIDAAEKVTQLNRPLDNNLWTEAQDLTTMLLNQLGLTMGVFDGTATEAQMTNYYNRTVEPILTAIVEEMDRKFLTKKARAQHQSIMYIRDPFKLVGVTNIAEMAKIFNSQEIMSSNEIRSKIGLPPVNEQRADMLLNKNINKVDSPQPQLQPQPKEDPIKEFQNDMLKDDKR